MKQIFAALLLTLTANITSAQVHESHKMQHGFILSDDDTFASHLVATKHHSRQVEISGELIIPSHGEQEIYLKRKLENALIKKTYLLFQAQQVELPEVEVGQVFEGHIIESKVGDYEPENIIVSNARFVVKAIHFNIENPFFKE